MVLVRWVLPGVLAVLGVVFLVLGGEANGAVGVMLLGVATVVWIFVGTTFLSRVSGQDRAAEEAAREEFARTGRWPHDPDADG